MTVPRLPPTPVPVDGATVLTDTETYLRRFVAFPTDAGVVAVTLWAAHAHLVNAFESSPRLALLSPEPGSGKTRVLEVLECLTPTPKHTVNTSVPALFRQIAATQPTLLMDEVDAIFQKRGKDESAEDLRGLLNAGHRKGATVDRCVGVGTKQTVQPFPVYSALALAGLGDLPDTLMSRSVIIRMRRRARSERVEPFRLRVHPAEGHPIRDRLVAWCDQVREDVGDAWPQMPAGVEDRPADVWEPLLAVADAAGGDWPDRARAACVELVAVAESREASLGVKLLEDLRTVYRHQGDPEALSTESLLEHLCALDESPWDDLRGKPLAARGLARMLKGYGIASVKVKTDGRALQGYRREHLWDAWERYLSPLPADAEPTEPEEPEARLRSSEAGSPVPDEVPTRAEVPDRNGTRFGNGTPEPRSDLRRSTGSAGSPNTGKGDGRLCRTCDSDGSKAGLGGNTGQCTACELKGA